MTAVASSRQVGPTAVPILHVHPSLRCNLACRHCYSSSSPANEQEIPFPVLERALEDAADMGYKVLSVSGGEPFLYKELAALLHAAKCLGLRTSVVTNGHYLKDDRLREIRDVLDTLAISIDGPPDLHDHLRASTGAF